MTTRAPAVPKYLEIIQIFFFICMNIKVNVAVKKITLKKCSELLLMTSCIRNIVCV